jgi:flagellar basal body-associated protein FliL
MAYKREIAIVLLMVLLLCGAWLLITRLGNKSGTAQTEFVTDAVHNAALTCYAVEGAYPTSLEYLRAHYGLAYDQSRYLVRYDSFGSNLMPDISVTEVEASDS